MKHIVALWIVVILASCLAAPAVASEDQDGPFLSMPSTQIEYSAQGEAVITSASDGYSFTIREGLGAFNRATGVGDDVVALVSGDNTILIQFNRITAAEFNASYSDLHSMVSAVLQALEQTYSVAVQGEPRAVTHQLSTEAYAVDLTLRQNGNTLDATYTYIKTSKYVYVGVTGRYGQISAERQEALSDVVATLKEIN